METKLYSMMKEYLVCSDVKKEQLLNDDTEIKLKEAPNGQLYLEDQYDNRVKIYFNDNGYLCHLSTDPYEVVTIVIKHLIKNYRFRLISQENCDFIMNDDSGKAGLFEYFLKIDTNYFNEKEVNHDVEVMKMKARKPFKNALRNGGDGIDFDTIPPDIDEDEDESEFTGLPFPLHHSRK